jgi:hypothetical protein
MKCPLEPIFRAAHVQLKPRTPVPDIRVEFFPFAGLTHTARFRQDCLLIRVSDLFTDAPQEVIQALASILLAKLYRKPVGVEHHSTYRAFILTGEMQERAQTARSSRGRGPRNTVSKGHWQDLGVNFDRLNAIYFGGSLERPRLAWSSRRSRRILGRYDATHNTIVISLLFDSPRIPDFVLDYVLYHELLHARHPSRAKNCRLVSHTPEFRAEERRFKDYKKATDWIREL